MISIISKLYKSIGLHVVQDRDLSEEERIEGWIWPGYADTMIGLKRFDNLQYCIETVIRENIPGNLIETGVWRRGASIFMRRALAAYGIMDRRVFIADSFEGLPETDKVKYPAEKSDRHHTIEFLAVSEEDVRKNFEKYNLVD